MEIFNDYTTSDVLFDIPFEFNNLKLYSVKVKDFKEFDKYTKYFIFSKKHYKLNNNENLFEFVFAVGMSTYNEMFKKKMQEKTEYELISLTAKDFGRMFSLICREEILLDEELLKEKNEISFINKEKTICINRNNFEIVRKVVLKQNALREPKIFENKTEEIYAQKYMKAQEKKKGAKTVSELGEIANLISCVTGKSYNELYDENILQFYTDYYRCVSLESYKTNTLFMTVSDKVKPIEYTEEVISKLFADPYEGMWKDKNSFGFLN